MDCSPSDSSVRGIFQVRMLEWVAISFSGGSSQPRDLTCVSCTAGRFFTTEPPTAAAAAAKSLQSCLTLCDPIDGSPPGSAVPGILQGRTLEWVAISFSGGSSWPRNRTLVSCIMSLLFSFCYYRNIFSSSTHFLSSSGYFEAIVRHIIESISISVYLKE